LEDIDENQLKSTDHNGGLINATEEILIEKKKKKGKADEKSKKKKHKKKDNENNSGPKESKEEKVSHNDIDLWLEDAKDTTDAKSTILDKSDRPSKPKKEKKKKKKHSKDKKRDRSPEGEQPKCSKTQCLVDDHGVKVYGSLQALNNSDAHNVKVTFTFENIKKDVALSDVEILLEPCQKISMVDPNPIKTNLPPQTSVEEHLLLKVDHEISTISFNGSILFKDINEKEVKLQFTLKISCLDLLIPVTDGLQDLLSVGALKSSQNLKKTCLIMTNFKIIMETINDRTKFASIEKTDNGTFLFAKHFSGNHVAIMLKFNPSDKQLTIEGKATDSTILTFVMNSVSDLIM